MCAQTNFSRALLHLRLQRCLSCFRQDKKLITCKDIEMLTRLCPEISTASAVYQVCWQCNAYIRSIIRFQKRVHKVQNMFHRATFGETFDTEGVWCLSQADVVMESINPEEVFKFNVDLEEELVKREIKLEPQDSLEVKEEIDDELTDDCEESDKMVIPSSDRDVSIAGPQKIQAIHPDLESKLKEFQKNCKEVAVTYENEIIATVKTMTEEEMCAFNEAKKLEKSYRTSVFKCELCVKKFLSKKKYDEHLAAHSDAVGEFTCHVCKLRFTTDNMMKEHFDSHYKRFSCLKCKYQTNLTNFIMRHYEQAHLISDIECKKCDATFKTYTDYKRHKRQTHYDSKECEICGRKFKCASSLKQHISQKHSTDVTSKIDQMVECNLCHRTYKHKQSLRAHNAYCHPKNKTDEAEEAFYCVECDMQFDTRAQYRTHMRLSKKHRPKDDTKYKCTECGKELVNATSLNHHVQRMHLKLLEHKCNICGKAFSVKGQLDRHKAIVHDNKQYPKNKLCDYCGKGFTNKRMLQIHMNKHTGARPFVCPECGASFGSPSALYLHRRLKHKVKKLKDQTADA